MIFIKKYFGDKVEDLPNGEVKYKVKIYHDNSEESLVTMREYVKTAYPAKYLEIGAEDFSFVNQSLSFFLWSPQDRINEVLQSLTLSNTTLALIEVNSEYASIKDFCEFIVKYCDLSLLEK